MSKATPITPDERGRIAVNLYKFVLWADTLRIQFEQTLARDRIELDRRRMMKLQILDKTAIEADMYVRLWFGFLYVVVEGWPQLQLKQNQPLQIQELLMNPWSDLLRKFRNATFHPADFDDASVMDMVSMGRDSIDWARELTIELKTYFESILF